MMKGRGVEYILVGTGRWGSSDPNLGVPVKWGHISEAKVIVEMALKDFNIESSQGTHFFQNVTSLGVGYLSINPSAGEGVFAQEVLDAMPLDYELEASRGQIAQYKEKQIQLEQKIKTLEDKLNSLQLAGAFTASPGDSAGAKRRLNAVIKEIDECISMLNM